MIFLIFMLKTLIMGTCWIKNKKNRYTHVNLSFTIQKWGSRGYTFHGHVFLMYGMTMAIVYVSNYVHLLLYCMVAFCIFCFCLSVNQHLCCI